jgi:hypothetical protein
MKQSSTIKKIMGGAMLSVVLVASSVATIYAAPKRPTPPSAGGDVVSGPQAKPPVEPGSVDAKQTEKLGETNQVKVNKEGKLEQQGFSALAGSVANVDFQTPYNYCWKNFVYTPVKNTTASTKYLRVMVWNQGMYRDYYTSVAANSTAYPAFYGVDGDYYAYLYVWDGSNYSYDEYLSSNNTCNVSVTRTYDTGGWVQLKIQNTGTAYATQISTELAPYPGSGTYTGTQYDYPVAGGAAIYRWFQVGTSPYGINSYTYGSFNMPYFFTGDH